jgi:hypothetical protein
MLDLDNTTLHQGQVDLSTRLERREISKKIPACQGQVLTMLMIPSQEPELQLPRSKELKELTLWEEMPEIMSGQDNTTLLLGWEALSSLSERRGIKTKILAFLLPVHTMQMTRQ